MLELTLRALLGLTYDSTRYEVIVVDDAADAETAYAVRRYSEVTLLQQDHLGVAKARNRGALAASGELLLFCDDDMELAPGHLRRCVETFTAYDQPLIGGLWDFAPDLVSGLGLTPFGRFRLALERDRARADGYEHLADGVVAVPSLSASNLLISRERFDALEGFDEDFRTGAEDQEFTTRARDSGAKLLLDTKLRCIHHDSWLTLAACCTREERNAEGMPLLYRKYPAEFHEVPYIRENRPVAWGDSPLLVAKKIAKRILAGDIPLGVLHRLTELFERAGASDRLLARLYTALYGLHLFRGFRQAWR